ncbi:hypothetical protein [Flavobacterium sp.]|uniref:hypothetical protein n=1 Tax=Flavobacterium sp. TaxID=239 RepID=UPI00375189C2
MNINIISRVNGFDGSGSTLVPFSWQFQISESDALIALVSPSKIKVVTPLGTKLISDEVYGGPSSFLSDWFLSKSILDNNYYLWMIPSSSSFLLSLTSINDVTLFTISVDDLHFEGVKNFKEPIPQLIDETYAFNFTIEASPWLIVTPNTGTGATILTIVPQPTASMTAGEYVGYVNIKNGATIISTINVTYSLYDFVESPYELGEKAFTLDTKYFNFKSANSDTYFQTNAIIKVYDFFTNTSKIFQVPQKVVTFETTAKLNLGRIIHRLMRRFATVNINELQYKFTELQLNVIEKLILNDTVVKNVTSDVIYFVAGLSKEITNIGFLDINPKPNRVTTNSFAYLNILIPSGTYVLKIFKNNAHIPLETIVLPNSDGKIITKKILFDSYNQGDIIDVVLDNTTTPLDSPPTKRYLVFPEGKYSCMVVWENEYLLQSATESTGGYTIKTDIEIQSQKVYKDFVEILENLSTSKEVKLNISTGWLAKTDIDSIESLMRSKKAWLIKNNQIINLRTIGKSILNEDSDRELIDFNLEFQINRSYDEETYSL